MNRKFETASVIQWLMNFFLPLIFWGPVFVSCNDVPPKKNTEGKTTIQQIGSIQLDSTWVVVESVLDQLQVPWDLAWGPDKNLYFSEQSGKIWRWNPTTETKKLLLNLSDVWQLRTTGLLGIDLYTDDNGKTFLYAIYTQKKDTVYQEVLNKYLVSEDTLLFEKQIAVIPANTAHNGSRVVVAQSGKIFWATGDAHHFENAQNIHSLNGKILRFNLDGSIPTDNPIPGSPVWAWGFRNMQGLTETPQGELFSSEHGDAVEDEVNLILPRKNYGWPIQEGYRGNGKKSIYQTPIASWTPTIAPAGLDYYGLDSIPEWKNHLVMATLKGQSLRVLPTHLSSHAEKNERIYFLERFGRIRDVAVASDGSVYFSTSNRDWNPPKGFPLVSDDRIIRLRKVSAPQEPILEDRGNRVQKSLVTTAINTKENGAIWYKEYCSSCHQPNGTGLPQTFPPLKNNERIKNDDQYLIQIMLKGMQGKMTLNGQTYTGQMPSFSFLKDEQIAAIANFIQTEMNGMEGKKTSLDVLRERKNQGKKTN